MQRYRMNHEHERVATWLCESAQPTATWMQQRLEQWIDELRSFLLPQEEPKLLPLFVSSSEPSKR